MRGETYYKNIIEVNLSTFPTPTTITWIIESLNNQLHYQYVKEWRNTTTTDDCVFQMPPKRKVAGRGKAPTKRQLAEEFPPGEVLMDTAKKTWKLGAPVGSGGFGLIYLGKNGYHNSLQYVLT